MGAGEAEAGGAEAGEAEAGEPESGVAVLLAATKGLVARGVAAAVAEGDVSGRVGVGADAVGAGDVGAGEGAAAGADGVARPDPTGSGVWATSWSPPLLNATTTIKIRTISTAAPPPIPISSSWLESWPELALGPRACSGLGASGLAGCESGPAPAANGSCAAREPIPKISGSAFEMTAAAAVAAVGTLSKVPQPGHFAVLPRSDSGAASIRPQVHGTRTVAVVAAGCETTGLAVGNVFFAATGVDFGAPAAGGAGPAAGDSGRVGIDIGCPQEGHATCLPSRWSCAMKRLPHRQLATTGMYVSRKRSRKTPRLEFGAGPDWKWTRTPH